VAAWIRGHTPAATAVADGALPWFAVCRDEGLVGRSYLAAGSISRDHRRRDQGCGSGLSGPRG